DTLAVKAGEAAEGKAPAKTAARKTAAKAAAEKTTAAKKTAAKKTATKTAAKKTAAKKTAAKKTASKTAATAADGATAAPKPRYPKSYGRRPDRIDKNAYKDTVVIDDDEAGEGDVFPEHEPQPKRGSKRARGDKDVPARS